MNPGTYDVSSTNTNGNDHTLWLPGYFSGLSAYWQFIDGEGAFVVTETGATLEATAQVNGGDSQVKVYLELAETTEGGSIKCWTTSCDTTNWDFFSYVSGTITGVSDDLDGLVLDMVQAGPAAQLGFGANDKDGGFGFSSWFNTSVSEANEYKGVDTSKHGDLNLSLAPAPVPLPAAGLMLIAGLGGLAAMRRRKSAS